MLLRSAVGMTHSLRSDLWWTIPFRVYYTQKTTTPILALKLSVSAIITPGGLPQMLVAWNCNCWQTSKGTATHSYQELTFVWIPRKVKAICYLYLVRIHTWVLIGHNKSNYWQRLDILPCLQNKRKQVDNQLRIIQMSTQKSLHRFRRKSQVSCHRSK